MRTKDKLIVAKREEIRRELTEWSKGHLEMGEQIIFYFSIFKQPIIQEGPSILHMTLRECFTRKRWTDANINPRHFVRARNCAINTIMGKQSRSMTPRYSAEEANNKTVREFIALGKLEISKTICVGKTTIESIEAFLSYYGIQLPE